MYGRAAGWLVVTRSPRILYTLRTPTIFVRDGEAAMFGYVPVCDSRIDHIDRNLHCSLFTLLLPAVSHATDEIGFGKLRNTDRTIRASSSSERESELSAFVIFCVRCRLARSRLQPFRNHCREACSRSEDQRSQKAAGFSRLPGTIPTRSPQLSWLEQAQSPARPWADQGKRRRPSRK